MFLSFAVYAQFEDWTKTPGCIVDEVPTLTCLEPLFGNILFAASSLVMLVLFVMFVIGAFNYLTSFGNPEKVKKAQGIFKFAIIGFILFLSAFLILKTIDVLFLDGKGEIFRFSISP